MTRTDSALVTTDGENIFPAYIDPDRRWNGWVIPAFTREAAQQVMDWTNNAAAEYPDGFASARWDGENIILHEAWWDEGEQDEVIEPSADGRYGIGAMAWTWYEKPALPALDDLVARVKREITEDIESGTVPADVTSFSALHDFVDANGYGGLLDDNSHVSTSLQIAMQEKVDAWLSAGRKEVADDAK